MIRSLFIIVFLVFPILLTSQIKNNYSFSLSYDFVGYSKDFLGFPPKDGYSKNTSSDLFQTSNGKNYSVSFEYKTKRKLIKRVTFEFSKQNYTIKQVNWSDASSPIHFSYPLFSLGLNYYPLQVLDKNNSLLLGLGLRRYLFFNKSLKMVERHESEDKYIPNLANSTLAIPAVLLKYEKRMKIGKIEKLALFLNASFDLPEGVLPSGYIESRPDPKFNLHFGSYLRTTKLQIGMKYEI